MPSTISATPFAVTVSVYGANPGRNYLRVDLFKDGTSNSNYFGETHNGTEWYFGSVGTSYFPLDILSSTSTASATFQAQIGEPSLTEYPGPGAYKLRIRRYTSASSYSPSGPYDVTIDIPTPTSTLTPTQNLTNTPTSAPTASPAPPTGTPTPTKVPIKTPTRVPTLTPTPVIAIEATPSSDVLGSESSPMPEAKPQKGSIKPVIFSLLLVSLGLALLALVWIWKHRRMV